jgi:glyoxylase-like metal-dependent hydrolase (beta-lactamase superfamily II)
MSPKPEVTGFFDKRTWSVQYVVADPETKKCAIVDPVLDYDEKSGQTATIHADNILKFVKEKGYEVEWILDTHPHADHFSAAAYLKEKTGAPTAIGEKVTTSRSSGRASTTGPTFRPMAPSGTSSSRTAKPSRSATSLPRSCSRRDTRWLPSPM